MRKGIGAQPDLFKAPARSNDLPEFLCGKTVELLRALLIEAITPSLAWREEKKDAPEGGNDHDHN
jgi:hypothetical protein